MRTHGRGAEDVGFNRLPCDSTGQVLLASWCETVADQGPEGKVPCFSVEDARMQH